MEVITTLAKKIWEEAKPEFGNITRASEVISIEFKELEYIYNQCNLKEIEPIIKKLARGAWLHVKNAFSPEEVDYIKSRHTKIKSSRPSEFYKMNSLIPNFWRDITKEVAQNYSAPVVKESAYFFPWNGEEKLFEILNRRWSIFKVFGGRKFDYAKANLPESGYVDRIQLIKYKPDSGDLPAHQDPHHRQKLIITCYLSKFGRDFTDGGFWLVDKDGKKLFLEDIYEPGDMGVGAAEITHGVDGIEGPKGSSRYVALLFTPDSDLVQARKSQTLIEL